MTQTYNQYEMTNVKKGGGVMNTTLKGYNNSERMEDYSPLDLSLAPRTGSADTTKEIYDVDNDITIIDDSESTISATSERGYVKSPKKHDLISTARMQKPQVISEGELYRCGIDTNQQRMSYPITNHKLKTNKYAGMYSNKYHNTYNYACSGTSFVQNKQSTIRDSSSDLRSRRMYSYEMLRDHSKLNALVGNDTMRDGVYYDYQFENITNRTQCVNKRPVLRNELVNSSGQKTNDSQIRHLHTNTMYKLSAHGTPVNYHVINDGFSAIQYPLKDSQGGTNDLYNPQTGSSSTRQFKYIDHCAKNERAGVATNGNNAAYSVQNCGSMSNTPTYYPGFSAPQYNIEEDAILYNSIPNASRVVSHPRQHGLNLQEVDDILKTQRLSEHRPRNVHGVQNQQSQYGANVHGVQNQQSQYGANVHGVQNQQTQYGANVHGVQNRQYGASINTNPESDISYQNGRFSNRRNAVDLNLNKLPEYNSLRKMELLSNKKIDSCIGVYCNSAMKKANVNKLPSLFNDINDVGYALKPFELQYDSHNCTKFGDQISLEKPSDKYPGVTQTDKHLMKSHYLQQSYHRVMNNTMTKTKSVYTSSNIPHETMRRHFPTENLPSDGHNKNLRAQQEYVTSLDTSRQYGSKIKRKSLKYHNFDDKQRLFSKRPSTAHSSVLSVESSHYNRNVRLLEGTGYSVGDRCETVNRHDSRIQPAIYMDRSFSGNSPLNDNCIPATDIEAYDMVTTRNVNSDSRLTTTSDTARINNNQIMAVNRFFMTDNMVDKHAASAVTNVACVNSATILNNSENSVKCTERVSTLDEFGMKTEQAVLERQTTDICQQSSEVPTNTNRSHANQDGDLLSRILKSVGIVTDEHEDVNTNNTFSHGQCKNNIVEDSNSFLDTTKQQCLDTHKQTAAEENSRCFEQTVNSDPEETKNNTKLDATTKCIPMKHKILEAVNNDADLQELNIKYWTCRIKNDDITKEKYYLRVGNATNSVVNNCSSCVVTDTLTPGRPVHNYHSFNKVLKTSSESHDFEQNDASLELHEVINSLYNKSEQSNDNICNHVRSPTMPVLSPHNVEFHKMTGHYAIDPPSLEPTIGKCNNSPMKLKSMSFDSLDDHIQTSTFRKLEIHRPKLWKNNATLDLDINVEPVKTPLQLQKSEIYPKSLKIHHKPKRLHSDSDLLYMNKPQQTFSEVECDNDMYIVTGDKDRVVINNSSPTDHSFKESCVNNNVETLRNAITNDDLIETNLERVGEKVYKNLESISTLNCQIQNILNQTMPHALNTDCEDLKDIVVTKEIWTDDRKEVYEKQEKIANENTQLPIGDLSQTSQCSVEMLTTPTSSHDVTRASCVTGVQTRAVANQIDTHDKPKYHKNAAYECELYYEEQRKAYEKSQRDADRTWKMEHIASDYESPRKEGHSPRKHKTRNLREFESGSLSNNTNITSAKDDRSLKELKNEIKSMLSEFSSCLKSEGGKSDYSRNSKISRRHKLNEATSTGIRRNEWMEPNELVGRFYETRRLSRNVTKVKYKLRKIDLKTIKECRKKSLDAMKNHSNESSVEKCARFEYDLNVKCEDVGLADESIKCRQPQVIPLRSSTLEDSAARESVENKREMEYDVIACESELADLCENKYTVQTCSPQEHEMTYSSITNKNITDRVSSRLRTRTNVKSIRYNDNYKHKLAHNSIACDFNRGKYKRINRRINKIWHRENQKIKIKRKAKNNCKFDWTTLPNCHVINGDPMKFNRRKVRQKRRKCKNRQGTKRSNAHENDVMPPETKECNTSPPKITQKILVNKTSGETILHRAARRGLKETVLYYLRSCDVDVNSRDHAGFTALHESCASDRLNVACVLLQYGADVNAASLDGIRPLDDAVAIDNIELVRLLLSHGADPHLYSTRGGTNSPVHHAKLDTSRSALFVKSFVGDSTKSENETPWCFPSSRCLMDPNDPVSDIFADVPDGESDGFDTEHDMEHDVFEFSQHPPIPIYKLLLPDSDGSNSYVLLGDVTKSLDISRDAFFIQYARHVNLHVVQSTWLMDAIKRKFAFGPLPHLYFDQQTELIEYGEFKQIQDLVIT